ncbi:hypothetical protein BRD18_08210 [Halobacteriales archaeon SW_7_71_33]|nr:MAG: hypothetical protein BRD18_08210 [Halobacteriales archaeon SW_7_71_33]
MNSLTQYDAVVFDMDGVLVERSPSWVFDEATVGAFETFDVEPREEDHDVLRSLGRLSETEVGRFERRYDVSADSLWAARESLAAINQLRAIETGEKCPYDGALATLDALDMPMGVVSNNSQQAVEMILRLFDFDVHLCSWYGLQPSIADAAHSKPDPRYLRRVLADLETDTAIYVGDRATDVSAAHRAGIDSVFVHRKFNDEETFETPPTYEVDSVRELSERSNRA